MPGGSRDRGLAVDGDRRGTRVFGGKKGPWNRLLPPPDSPPDPREPGTEKMGKEEAGLKGATIGGGSGWLSMLQLDRVFL